LGKEEESWAGGKSGTEERDAIGRITSNQSKVKKAGKEAVPDCCKLFDSQISSHNTTDGSRCDCVSKITTIWPSQN
jgi:hypothetical protein